MSTPKPKRIILPPIWLLFTLGAQYALRRWWPLADFSGPVPVGFGAILLVLGVSMSAVSARRFARADTGIVPFHEARHLVTGGFYRFTRNPMYLGMVFSLLGVALLMGRVGAFLPIPLFVLVIQWRYVLPEEQFLEDAFGGEYLAFKERVRRWL